MKTERLTGLALLTAAAMMLSWVESLLPAFTAVPGVKVGLANTASLFALYMLSEKDAWIVSAVRIILSSVLFGTMFSLVYSASGAVVSLAIMCLMKKTGLFSVTGVSVAGGVAHNAGQLAAAMLIMETKGLVYYSVPLIISGIIAGTVVGLAAGFLMEHLPANMIRH